MARSLLRGSGPCLLKPMDHAVDHPDVDVDARVGVVKTHGEGADVGEGEEEVGQRLVYCLQCAGREGNRRAIL